jgi:hypothetical protein
MNKESDCGYIEYKRSIKNISDSKIISYASQMKYRLNEGNHICYYYIGVNDNGTIYGLDQSVEKILETLNKILYHANAHIVNYNLLTLYDKTYLEFKITDDKNIPEYRILIVGKRNSGKNTFISNCLYNSEDDFNGSSKKFLINNGRNNINYYPIGLKSNTINNYINCQDIHTIKLESDILLYLVNLPYNYKYIDNIELNNIFTLIFIKDIFEINDYKITNFKNCIFMLRDDTIKDFILDTNVCKYNNKISSVKSISFISYLIKKYVYSSTCITIKPFNYLNIIDILYSFSNNKYLLLVLAQVSKNNKSNNIVCGNVPCKINSIYLTGICQDYINQYDFTYTVIVTFDTNVYKLKGKTLLFI